MRSSVTTGVFHTRDGIRRPHYLHARYYDRPDLIRHSYNHIHTYYDYHHRLCHRIIWPRYYYPIWYRFGPHVVRRHVYPYYHRKYVFVSLGGYWPTHCSYTRYYWYGWHPYVWYGYYPVAQEVATGTNNYYTYNYYNSTDEGAALQASYSSDAPVDQSTWEDVREKLDEQQPAPQTLADTRFEEGVKSFEGGNYGVAAEKFATAMGMAPDDMILPFAYAQALFADEQYSKAAEVLRESLQKVTPEKEGVFYPRGLYADDDVLFAQIEDLVDKLDKFGYDADLQLLLGYHLLGVGETGYAREPLERASQDIENAESARVLLKLLEKMEAEAASAKTTDAASAESSDGKIEIAGAAPRADAPASGTEPTGAAALSAAPDSATQSGPNVLGVQRVEPSVEKKAEEEIPAPQGEGAGSTVERPESVSRADEQTGRGRPLLAVSREPNPKADLAIFALITSLGSTAVYAEWKFVGRRFG